MSAKSSKKGAKREGSPTAAPTSAVTPFPGAVTAGGATMSVEPAAAWIDSTDPRKRTIGKIVLIGVWIYVAALWLLALDQTFHWGIFGPKIPPIP